MALDLAARWRTGSTPLCTPPVASQGSDNLAIADQGSQTQGVNTFADGGGSALGALGNILGWPSSTPSGPSQSISLKPFLDRADGGTGANLSGGGSQRGGP